MYRTVIAAIDGTRASFEAGRQAARLTSPDGELLLLAAIDPYMAMSNQWGPGRLVRAGETDDISAFGLAKRRLEERADESLREMREQLPADLRVTLRLESGRPWDALRRVGTEVRADLIVLGSHGGRRFAGIALGSTATEMLHVAPCSVLIARLPFAPARFPLRVVVGVDGSTGSLAALDAARLLTAGGDTRALALACAGSSLDVEGLRRLAGTMRVEAREERPVEAMVEAAEAADLVVVGARGMTGVRALGSVSERVAHRSESSVLVVRTAD